MTDHGPGPTRVFGWCQSAPGTKPDTHHNLCRKSFTSSVGVVWTCSCEAHNDEEATA